LQYYFATDLQAAAPNSTAVVPRGGSFSVNVPVDPAGKLSDDASVATALNSVIAAAQAAGAVPGTFRVDSSHPGVFFVEPATRYGDFSLNRSRIQSEHNRHQRACQVCPGEAACRCGTVTHALVCYALRVIY
jgi:hypothetical protein